MLTYTKKQITYLWRRKNTFLCCSGDKTMSLDVPKPVLQPNISTDTVSPIETSSIRPTEIRVFFDIDFTLMIIAPLNKWEFLSEFSHLTNVKSLYPGDTYFIFLEQTKLLFQWLLANNIKIGFATHSGRKKKEILSLLEKQYELGVNALANSIYLDGTALAKHTFTKSQRLDDMADFLEIKQDVVFLVDDKIRQLDLNFKGELKVYGIHAQGFSTEQDLAKIKNFHRDLVTINDQYLTTIKEQVSLKIIEKNNKNELLLTNTTRQNLALTIS